MLDGVAWLDAYLVQFTFTENERQTKEAERHQHEQNKRESQGSFGELDDPEQRQAKKLDDGEEVHLECSHLEYRNTIKRVALQCTS